MSDVKHEGLAIRFDGPPAPESGRFVEVEVDGESVSVGEWKQDGDTWVLVLGPAYAVAPELLSVCKLAHKFLDSLPVGWLGKTTGDIGTLNDFYIESSKLGLTDKG